MNIDIKCSGTEYKAIDELKELQKDIKKLSKKNFEKLKNSILKYGFSAPFFVWDNGINYNILDGHQRLRVLLEMRKEGYTIPLMPVVYVSASNEKEAREKLLYITSQYGEFNISNLKEFIIDLDIENINLLGNKPITLDYLKADTIDDDKIQEENIKNITKKGDLWELGRHRLLCGEFPIDYNFINIDYILTDPPYGINIVNRKNKIGNDKKNTIGNLGTRKIGYNNIIKANYYKPILNDDKEFDPSGFLEITKNLIIFGGNYFANKLPNSAGWLVWDKNEGREWNDTFADGELIYTSFKIHTKIYRVLWKGMVRKERDKRVHPTQKPVELLCLLLQDFIEKNKIILDMFLGSGSTLIACEKTDRICYGMELDEYYCDIIVRRYIDWCEKNSRKIEIKLNNKKIDYKELVDNG